MLMLAPSFKLRCVYLQLNSWQLMWNLVIVQTAATEGPFGLCHLAPFSLLLR